MSLTPTVEALLGLVAWPLLLLVMIAGVRVIKVMKREIAINKFDPDGLDMPGFPHRLTRAQANCVENLPMQGAILLFAIATNQTAVTDPLACTLLGARLFQSVVHLISIKPLFVNLRFLGLVVQVLILGWWILKFAGCV